MPRRLRRVVPLLATIAAAGFAADGVVEIRNARGGETLQIALDELQLVTTDSSSPVDAKAADPRIASVAYAREGGRARATVQRAASVAELAQVGRKLVASGAASGYELIAHPPGSSDPRTRVAITRRLAIGYTGAPDDLAKRNGCRVDELLSPGVWVLTALGDDPLAGVTAAAKLAKAAGVTFAEPLVKRSPLPYHVPRDPLYNAYTPPAPYYPAWWDLTLPAPAWSPTSDWPFNPVTRPATGPGSDAVIQNLVGPIPLPDLPNPLLGVDPGAYWPLNPLPAGTPPDNYPGSFGDNGQWHLHAFPGQLNCAPVWTEYTGLKINVSVVDTALEYTHEDLGAYPDPGGGGAIRADLALNVVTPGASILPQKPGAEDSHSTSVSGTIAAGANNVGGVGVAYDAKIIPIKFLQSFDDRPGQIPTAISDDADYAKSINWQVQGSSKGDTSYISNNSWGYEGVVATAPGSAGMAALKDAILSGRFARGVIHIFAAGNSNGNDDGTMQPGLHPNDNAAYDGYINRYTIGVGALNRAGAKTFYSEIGPNLLVAAPGGELSYIPNAWVAGHPLGYFNNAFVIPGGIITTDRMGANGFDIGVANTFKPTAPAIWRGDYTLVHPYRDRWCAANSQEELAGTSFAAPNVAGVVALMLQARPSLTWRDVQSVLARRAGKPPGDLKNMANAYSIPGLVVDADPWYTIPIPGLVYGAWMLNQGGAGGANGLYYNLYYGYGSVDAVKAVYGLDDPDVDIDPANVDLDEATQLSTFGMRYDNPGALHMPLLPAEGIPLAASFIRDKTKTDRTDATSGYIPFARPVGFTGAKHRLIENFTISTAGQSGFVAETAELHVHTTGLTCQAFTFVLESPSGTHMHVPQRIAAGDGSNFDFTFTFQGFRDEDPSGTWKLFVIDSVSLGDFLTSSTVGILERADLTIHGHLPYPTPTIPSTPIGVPAGRSSTFTMTGSKFAKNANGEVTMTTGVWYDVPANLNTPLADMTDPAVVIYHLSAAATNSTQLNINIPAALVDPTTSPGDAILEIGNPELPYGQDPAVVTDANGSAFQNDVWETANAPIIYTAPIANEKQRLKLAGGNASPTQVLCRYSRPPTITPIADQLLPAGSKTGIWRHVTVTVDDPDITLTPNANRTGVEETLTVEPVIFNTSVVTRVSKAKIPDALLPAGHGLGVWDIGFFIDGTSGLSLIQVGVTDGVTTTYSAFRVGILAEDDASGCGGGMGLALLGTPLAVWLFRRRRR